VGSAADVYFVATMLSQIEAYKGFKPINIHVLIETALGMANVEEIARACPERMEAMVFGVADYAASVRARTTQIGGANPDYGMLTDPDENGMRAYHWGDQWHFAISRMVAACRAYGLRPIDGPFGDFNDPEGYKVAARRAAALGCEGKWAIHPSQVALANEVFTPTEKEVSRARRILVEMEKAAKEGKGAVSLDGRLIDAASIRMAENVVKQIEQIEARKS
jgi:malyl-CoA/(S)-citramalyl-CoA lyase